MEERVVKFMEMLDKAVQEPGGKKPYTVNITSDPPMLSDLAKRVRQLGGDALMVDAYSVGLGAFRQLAEDFSINVPTLHTTLTT